MTSLTRAGIFAGMLFALNLAACNPNQAGTTGESKSRPQDNAQTMSGDQKDTGTNGSSRASGQQPGIQQQPVTGASQRPQDNMQGGSTSGADPNGGTGTSH